jgi:hypothetical protein
MCDLKIAASGIVFYFHPGYLARDQVELVAQGAGAANHDEVSACLAVGVSLSSVCLFVVFLSVCLSVRLSFCLPVFLPLRLSVSVCLLFVSLSVCLFVCLHHTRR